MPSPERSDLAVIGAGLVGLATAWQLQRRFPRLRIAVLEKEDAVAAHQSGHNTGVIHAGIYYRPGTLRARLCREGKAELETFAEARGIPFRRSGKLIVALRESEFARLDDLAGRARANGVQGIEILGPERIREIEPHLAGGRALWSPTSGVIHFPDVARALAAEVRAAGGEILTGRRVTAIRRLPEGMRLVTGGGDHLARRVVSCAGLHSDRVAAMTGDRGQLRIIPFRGDYWAFRPEARHLVKTMVNPVPDPRFPFLGVHFTRTVRDEVWAGPNAVLAFAREGYRFRHVSARDLAAVLGDAAFWKLARSYGRTAAGEFWRDLVKAACVRGLQAFLPELRAADLVPGPSGVRAQAVDSGGTLLDEFSFGESEGILHVRNAPSPGATASLAIGRHLAGRAAERFGLA